MAVVAAAAAVIEAEELNLKHGKANGFDRGKAENQPTHKRNSGLEVRNCVAYIPTYASSDSER